MSRITEKKPLSMAFQARSRRYSDGVFAILYANDTGPMVPGGAISEDINVVRMLCARNGTIPAVKRPKNVSKQDIAANGSPGNGGRSSLEWL